jgi:hypothetical protein
MRRKLIIKAANRDHKLKISVIKIISDAKAKINIYIYETFIAIFITIFIKIL